MCTCVRKHTNAHIQSNFELSLSRRVGSTTFGSLHWHSAEQHFRFNQEHTQSITNPQPYLAMSDFLFSYITVCMECLSLPCRDTKFAPRVLTRGWLYAPCDVCFIALGARRMMNHHHYTSDRLEFSTVFPKRVRSILFWPSYTSCTKVAILSFYCWLLLRPI